jgi:hypothetical protein
LPNLFRNVTAGLDEPFAFESKGWFKNNKVRIVILNEDLSFSEYWHKYPSSYVFTVRKKDYLFNSKAILRGKFPLLIYYYNNPFPLLFKYEKSSLTALDLRSPEQVAKLSEEQRVFLANVSMDSETINLAFTTRVMRGLYAKTGLTPKALLIIGIVVFIMILVILQISGKVDIIGAFTKKR